MNKEYEDFIVQDNKIIIKDHVKAAKPVTGTKVGSITLDNKFSSPFVAFMNMYRFDMPIEITPQIQKGFDLEPKVIELINELENLKFKNYTSNPYYDWEQEGIGKKYNGKIDGWEENKKIVLECKVTNIKNKTKWFSSLPKYYLLQMLLYSYLSKANECWLAAYFVEDYEYEMETPKKLDQNKLKIWKFKFDKKTKVLFESKLNIIEEFYKNHIDIRTSPKFDISKQCDRELLDYLKVDY